MSDSLIFNPAPGWPKPPKGWRPPSGWKPDPSWPSPPDGWQLWITVCSGEAAQETVDSECPSAALTTYNKVSEHLEQEPTNVKERLALLESENAALREKLEATGDDIDKIIELDDERVLQSVGIYKYHHPLENAVSYKQKLDALGARIAKLVKSKCAINKSNMFTYDNSIAKGRRMTQDLATLMLRAYNAEADNSIRSLRLGNVVTAKKRIEASRTAIAKLGKMMEMYISDEFHALRLEEIELTADWFMKKKEEKEAAREDRARLREERIARKELAEERERLAKERKHIENALLALRQLGQRDTDLEAKLAAIDDAIVRNDYRIANIRAGYVYVISNRGAFAKDIVKIGLTRRLEPLDRINELGGASVPFRFDVHALFFSEDAVGLESELHDYFSARAVNMVNSRKEFFFATPCEVREALIEKVGNLLEFTEAIQSTEYFQSLPYWPQSDRPKDNKSLDPLTFNSRPI